MNKSNPLRFSRDERSQRTNTALRILAAAVLFAVSACSSPSEKALEELERRGIEASEGSLLSGAMEGSVETVRLLLEAGISPEAVDGDGYSALAWASSRGHAGTVLALLDGGADVNGTDGDGDTALTSALINGEDGVARALLAAGADPNTRNASGRIPLGILFDREDIGLAETILEAGALPDGMVANDFEHEHTLLAEAAYRGMVDAIRILLDRGADVNGSSPDGDPPIVAAARGGMKGPAKLLIEKGAAVDKAGHGGRTALSIAVGYGDYPLVELLLEAGADPDLPPGRYFPPLIQAAVGGEVEIVRALIAHGADITVRDHRGRSASEAAMEAGNQGAAALLRGPGLPAE